MPTNVNSWPQTKKNVIFNFSLSNPAIGFKVGMWMASSENAAEIGIIGGTGVYAPELFGEVKEIKVYTRL